jgi:two-component system sensor kinase FixL
LDTAAISFHTDVLADIFGAPPDQMPTTVDEYCRWIHPDDVERMAKHYEVVAKENQNYTVDYRIIRPDGETRYIHEIGVPIHDDLGKLVEYTGTLQDITEEKVAEEALRESELRLQALQTELLRVSRVSAVEQLGSALAHELNQPLTAIMNYVQACRRVMEAGGGGVPDGVYEMMDKAIAQADRAGAIIRGLRRFVEKRETERSYEDFNRVVEEAASFGLIGASEQGVRVAFDLCADLPRVLVDKIQIQQVVLNLVRNAVRAMAASETRELTITTSRNPHDAVETAICDTGSGLREELVEQLFQPFVTTKTDGMGIGLSICHSVVDSHGGRLWATPNPGGGTIFRFTIPMTPPADARHEA